MISRDNALAGAQVILERCLGLSADSHFVLLLDETAVEVLDPLFLAASALDIQMTTLFYSLEQQRTLQDLGNTAKKIIADADAALLAHTDRTDCSGFRTKLVSKWRQATRLGTMPGAKRFVLETAAQMDEQFIVAQCRTLTLPLLHGRTCVITTFDSSGRPYHLSLQLGGIDRTPVQSTGILGPHAWGNIPSGEIFTAPLELSAEGEYLVNGAIGTLVLSKQEVVLTFTKGRLIRHRFLDSGESVRYLDEVQRLSEDRADKNWNVLAEFGIGVNQGIKEVTGFSLLDEKMFGSVHIAIGNNKGWQGENESQIHLDVITKLPTVAIDNRLILERGKHVVKPEEFDDLTTYEPPPRYRWPRGAKIASIFRDRVHRDERGVLRIELPSTQSGRVTEAPLADEQTRQLVSQIQRSAGRLPALDSLTDIEGHQISQEMLHKLLSLLWSYGLVHPEQK